MYYILPKKKYICCEYLKIVKLPITEKEEWLFRVFLVIGLFYNIGIRYFPLLSIASLSDGEDGNEGRRDDQIAFIDRDK